MNEQTRPSRDEICVVLASIADKVQSSQDRRLDPIVSTSIIRAINELKRHIPGLFDPPDDGTAAALETAAHEAMRRGQFHKALARSLRGLSFSPHHPGLWHLLGWACFQFGHFELTVRAWQHCDWIYPGHPTAKRDLETLSDTKKRSRLIREWDSSPPASSGPGLDDPSNDDDWGHLDPRRP